MKKSMVLMVAGVLLLGLAGFGVYTGLDRQSMADEHERARQTLSIEANKRLEELKRLKDSTEPDAKRAFEQNAQLAEMDVNSLNNAATYRDQYRSNAKKFYAIAGGVGLAGLALIVLGIRKRKTSAKKG